VTGPRVSVIGVSGSGKTTLGRTLASRLDVPFVELDSIFHQPGWQELDADEFRARVRAVVDGAGWVIDGNYSSVRPLVLARATTVVWLDYERPLVMERVIRRSVARAITKSELWNGNREMARFWLRADHPIRWAWSQHARKRVEYEARLAMPEHAHLHVVRLPNPSATRRWLEAQ
jgi:adenylate kinase family enzyme